MWINGIFLLRSTKSAWDICYILHQRKRALLFNWNKMFVSSDRDVLCFQYVAFIYWQLDENLKAVFCQQIFFYAWACQSDYTLPNGKNKLVHGCTTLQWFVWHVIVNQLTSYLSVLVTKATMPALLKKSSECNHYIRSSHCLLHKIIMYTYINLYILAL